MELHKAIVLKNHMPYKHKVSLLDSALGHLSGITLHEMFSDTLSAGMFIAYTINTSNQRYFFKDIEQLAAPFALARHDMSFLHHMLELCYTFIPEGAYAQGVYELLYFIVDKPFLTKQQKRKILCILCVMLDLYADNAPFYNSYMHSLAQVPLDAILDTELDINIEKNISRWLYQCIGMHARVQQLKTIHFLDEIL